MKKHSVSQSARKLMCIIVIVAALIIKSNARKAMEVSECKKDSMHHCVFTRVAKCHGYDGYIRVKILAGWGKSLRDHAIWQNQAFWGEDLYKV